MAGRIDIALKWFDHGRGLELPRQQSAGAAGVDLLAAVIRGDRAGRIEHCDAVFTGET
jgi:dUTPase